MTRDHRDADKDERDRLIEREARASMKYSMEQAVLRSGGGGLMKGGTPVSCYEQAHHQIMVFLDQTLHDAVLEKALDTWIGSHLQQVQATLDNPIQGLLDVVDYTLGHEGSLVELVRTIDVRYGQVMMERPYFQQPGETPHAEDPYTFASVRQTLERLAAACREQLGQGQASS